MARRLPEHLRALDATGALGALRRLRALAGRIDLRFRLGLKFGRE
jgi:hypothetical protein